MVVRGLLVPLRELLPLPRRDLNRFEADFQVELLLKMLEH
jgi:hypothetical protein